MMLFERPQKFDWNKGNKNKNWIKHKVTDEECEEAFFDANKKILKDVLHSESEIRSILLGKKKAGRILFVVFTMRGKLLRVISARDLNKKERLLYEEQA